MRAKKIFIPAIGLCTFLFTGCQESIPKATMERGKKAYQTYCLGCHMEDGSGVPGMNAPLIGSRYVAGNNAKLISIVLEGSPALMDDPSRNYKNLMGSMPNLTDEEIADVLTYVRNSFTNKGAAITPAEVKTVRDKRD